MRWIRSSMAAAPPANKPRPTVVSKCATVPVRVCYFACWHGSSAPVAGKIQKERCKERYSKGQFYGSLEYAIYKREKDREFWGFSVLFFLTSTASVSAEAFLVMSYKGSLAFAVISLLRKRYDMIALFFNCAEGTSQLGAANHNSKLAAGDHSCVVSLRALR